MYTYLFTITCREQLEKVKDIKSNVRDIILVSDSTLNFVRVYMKKLVHLCVVVFKFVHTIIWVGQVIVILYQLIHMYRYMLYT